MDGAAQIDNGAYIDLRDIYHSTASSGCDSIVFVPKYWYNQKMQMDNISLIKESCIENTLANTVLINNLAGVSRFALNEDRLLLYNDEGKNIITALIDASDEKGSLTRKWRIEKMINIKDKDLEKAGAYIDLSNMERGTAYFGCNLFSLTAHISEQYFIDLTGIGITKKYCSEYMIMEEVFTKALPLVKMFQVIGNTVKLYDKDGILLIQGLAHL